MNKKNWWVDFVKGTSLGLGMVPGVSAGTMALVVGIYDKLVGSVSRLRKHFKESVLVLLPIVLGAVLSCIIFFVGVKYGYDYAPFAITCLFAGLIIGTLPLITKEIKNQKTTAKSLSLIIIGFVIAAGIGVLSVVSKLYWGFNLEDGFVKGEWWVYLACFAAGFVATMACVIPGISGAMILFIFGLYTPVANIFMGNNSMFHNHARIGSGIGLTIALLIGAIAGAIITSKLMNSLLEKNRVPTFDVVLGFILGSIIAMFLNQNMITDGGAWIYATTKILEYVIGGILLIASAIGFFFISKITLKKQELAKISLEEGQRPTADNNK